MRSLGKILIFFPLYIICLFSLAAFKSFLLITDFQLFDMTYLGMVFFVFILLCVYWISWCCIVFIKFGNFLAIFQILFLPFPPHFWDSVIYVRLWYCPTGHWDFVHLFFSPAFYSILRFHWSFFPTLSNLVIISSEFFIWDIFVSRVFIWFFFNIPFPFIIVVLSSKYLFCRRREKQENSHVSGLWWVPRQAAKWGSLASCMERIQEPAKVKWKQVYLGR